MLTAGTVQREIAWLRAVSTKKLTKHMRRSSATVLATVAYFAIELLEAELLNSGVPRGLIEISVALSPFNPLVPDLWLKWYLFLVVVD